MNSYKPVAARPVQLPLPLPSLQKSIFIYARGEITASGQRRIETWIGRASYSNWQIITGDNIYADLQIASMTKRQKVNHKTYGITKRPRNNTSTRNYTQFASCANRLHCDRYMINQADMIVCVWDGLSQQTIAVYNYARSFRHKRTFISTHAQPYTRVNGKRPFLRAGYTIQRNSHANVR